MTGLTVVIGGGAAGIAAARRLHAAGREVLLVEAADRLGGRARSVRLTTGHVVDAGCGWLHSAERNPWTAIAEQQGLTIDRSSPRWDEQWRDLGYTRREQSLFGGAWGKWEARARMAVGGTDRPMSDFVDADDPWRPQLDAISGYVNGAPLAEVSLHDWAAYEDAATPDNWAIEQGYGTAITAHAAGVPVRLGTAVTRIDHRGPTLRIETAAGMIEADRVIVTVPTSVIATGALAFDPPLPAKQAAADALPLGLADKVFLQVSGDVPWPARAHLIGNPHSAMTASYRLSPFGWPIVEAFFGGVCARSLESGDAAAFAIDQLVALLGSEWRARLTPLLTTRWGAEPLIGGSYSHARVGAAGQRQVLGEPVDGRILFAGEACSRTDFGTAHGAYATGVAAAEAVLAAG